MNSHTPSGKCLFVPDSAEPGILGNTESFLVCLHSPGALFAKGSTQTDVLDNWFHCVLCCLCSRAALRALTFNHKQCHLFGFEVSFISSSSVIRLSKRREVVATHTHMCGDFEHFDALSAQRSDGPGTCRRILTLSSCARQAAHPDCIQFLQMADGEFPLQMRLGVCVCVCVR